jgi:FkbM family methyltransferase
MTAAATLKKLARQGLRRAGLERVRTPSIAQLLAEQRIETVLDVGANEGQFALELRELGYRGRIISFEPIPEVFAKLQARAATDPSWDVYNLGLGAEDGELPLHVASSSVFSSFKHPGAYVSEAFSASRIVRDEPVKIVRLDDFLAAQPDAGRTLLKVDTQGYEEEVLLGAGERLRGLAAIQLELPIVPLYDGQKSWIEMIRHLEDAGFRVAMAKENSYDWKRMRLLELDVIFVNERLGDAH